MKKTITLFLAALLILVSIFCCALGEEEPKFVTIQEWLENMFKGPRPQHGHPERPIVVGRFRLFFSISNLPSQKQEDNTYANEQES